MNSIRNVAVTGYVGTGSSAVLDLLREFDNCGIAMGEDQAYEHVPFYADNGLFDLGNTLLNGNSPLRSDTAISSFIESMRWLNDNDFGWFGSYKKNYDDFFMNSTMDFVNSISTEATGVSYSHYKRTRFSLIKIILQLGAKLVYNRPIHKYGRVYVYDKKKMYFSMPTEEEFYAAAKLFTRKYFEMCAIPGKEIMVYDHLLWPQQAGLMKPYFEPNFKMIVVRRDARDLYNLNKNFWYKPPVGVGTPLFPTEPTAFIDYWKRVSPLESSKENNILYINFEDLVYKYDDTVNKIMCFLNLDEKNHVNKGKFFDPLRSIKNTQTFEIKEDWKMESNIIKNEIPEYTYQFPYKNDTKVSEMFDA